MRILFIVPRMFSREELTNVAKDIPEDFDAKSKEFWDYVAERLKRPRVINRIYYDSLTKDGEEGNSYINENNEKCGSLIRELVAQGATVHSSEDSLLVEETASWVAMLEKAASKEKDPTIIELLSQNMSDRNKFLAKIIDETLEENETGLLFIRPGRDMGGYFPQDFKVIKIQPFEPSDYLNSLIVSRNLKSGRQD